MKRSLFFLLPLVLVLALSTPPARAQGEEPTTDASAEATEAGATETDATSEEEEPAEDRISFNVKIDDASGGGRVTGSAGDLTLQEGEYLLASGGVDLKYRALKLKAESVRLDIRSNLLTAEGNVVLDEGPERLTGEALEYDLDTSTGKVTQATAYVDPDYYFSGRSISKVGEQTFTVEDGVFTSCEQDVPSWSIALSSARITLEEYARIRNARLKFKKLPVLYMPYILWPATTERTSGFLVPKPGYSNRRGASLDLAYYKVLGRSADTTFFFDVSSESYFGFGNETRWRPSEDSEGFFKAYFLSEPDDAWVEGSASNIPIRNPFDPGLIDPETGLPIGDDRWKFELFHKTKNLWGNFDLVIDLEEYSDFDYLQDYERNANNQARPFIYSRAFLSANYSKSSLNILVDQRERIQRNNNDIRRQLPEIEYRIRSTKLGNSPVYFSLDSAVHYVDVDVRDQSVDVKGQYGRFNLEPNFSIPFGKLPWLKTTLNFGGQAVYYTDSLAPAEEIPPADEGGTSTFARRELGGGSIDRVVPTASLELLGPKFVKIFDKKSGRFSKIKHVIEPQVTYSFIDEFEDELDELGQIIPDNQREDPFLFDEIDTIRPGNGITVALANRFKAKPRDEESGDVLEIASITLSQNFSFDDDKPLQTDPTDPTRDLKEGPMRLDMRLNPSRNLSFDVRATYNTLESDFQAISFTGERRFGPKGPSGVGQNFLGLTWTNNRNVRAGTTTSDQLRLFGKLDLLPKRLSLEATVSYDIEDSELLQQRYFLKWQAQCYSWHLELRESKLGDNEETDLRFALTLKNVGTFLDLNESL